MLGVILGLGASLCWGTSDFVGGLESRRSPQIGVMLAGATIGLALVVAVLIASGAEPPAPKYLLAAAGGGVSVTVGLFAFYRALAIGLMSIAAPVASTGVVIPVIVGIAGGDRPNAVSVAGSVLAIVGVIFVSRQQRDASRHASAVGLSVVFALIGAVGFGGEFVGLGVAAKGDPLWAAATGCATYAVLLTVIAAATAARGRSIAPRSSGVRSLVALGMCFGAANAFFALGNGHGELSAVSVAASLYPAVTVVLARALLDERVSRIQGVGIVAALVGVVMIAAA